ncbi:hypothetical protein PFISCL1PPCAC_2308, partial [Pristionchus fissidentatus]
SQDRSIMDSNGRGGVPPPATPSTQRSGTRRGVEWYDSPSVSFQRKCKSDIPKTPGMEDDPFFGKKLDGESNSCDGFDSSTRFTTRKFRRRLRPSIGSDGIMNTPKMDEEKMKETTLDSALSSPASSSSSFQAGGEDIIELGKKTVRLLKSRSNLIVEAESDSVDISTPTRKRKAEDEEIKKDGEKRKKEENGDKSSITLLTPSLSRGSSSKKGCIDGVGSTTPLSGIEKVSIEVLTRRSIGNRPLMRDELRDTPENSQKEEKRSSEETRRLRRAKHADEPGFDSDDSFYDSD